MVMVMVLATVTVIATPTVMIMGRILMISATLTLVALMDAMVMATNTGYEVTNRMLLDSLYWLRITVWLTGFGWISLTVRTCWVLIDCSDARISVADTKFSIIRAVLDGYTTGNAIHCRMLVEIEGNVYRPSSHLVNVSQEFHIGFLHD